MMIALGSDHGGYALKKEIMKHLDEKGIAYKDFGTYTEDSCDYPLYGEEVGKAVVSGEYERGIIICGTGIGISIAANKVRGVRAALCGDCYSAEFTRRHNDANVLALGARVIGPGLALKIVDIFLNTEFEGGRHAKRVDLISDIEARHI
ncbi:MAG: ribose 5-phosphate isomerase B [Oscillospiraceae bacterium]